METDNILLETIKEEYDENTSINVVLILGPALSGKSTYIAETYGTQFYELIDRKSFNENQTYPLSWSNYKIQNISEALFLSYIQEKIEEMKKHLILETLTTTSTISKSKHDTLIIEDRLMTRTTRTKLITAIKPLLTAKDTLTTHFIIPNKTDYTRQIATHSTNIVPAEVIAQTRLDIIERPTNDEYLGEVIYDTPQFHTINETTKTLVEKWNRRDTVYEKDLLGIRAPGIVKDTRIKDFKGRVVTQEKYNHSMSELWQATKLLDMYVNDIIPKMEMALENYTENEVKREKRK